MGVPKKKMSKCQARIRRANSYYKMKVPNLAKCSHCGASKLPHRVCRSCGTYNGRKVFAGIEEA